ncbi:asparagine synthase B [Roseibium sp. M-1]
MCSIFAILDLHSPVCAETRQLAVAQSHKIYHRGPDANGIVAIGGTILAHNRISVVDVFRGGQPIVSAGSDAAVVANAEIYNHQEIRSLYPDYGFKTQSDCEAIIPLVLDKGKEGIDQLRGMFAFVLSFENGRRFYIARDRIGILSLYYGFDSRKRLHVASELKALTDACEEIHVFPPGHYLTESHQKPVPYFEIENFKTGIRQGSQTTDEELNDALQEAVQAHLMSDVEIGFLLSGGLDSSLIASIATRIYRKNGVERLKSYSVGLENSPDLAAAREVAEYLELDHHEHVYTVQEGLDALRQTIYHLESYDVTSVRASVPMYLLARKIRGDGTKVVLTGDGADESFAGYLYFHNAPNAVALHEECVTKLEAMHLYDCLRANKTMLSWGVEPRVPFLDKQFLEFAMRIDPAQKMPGKGRIEKHLLRSAFEGFLPNSILWRQKEQSSDGVGYDWIDGLKKYAESQVTDVELAMAVQRYPHNTPRSKEAFLYRKIFEDLFPHPSAVYCAPDGKSSGNATKNARSWLGADAIDDPSGRALTSIHRHAMLPTLANTQ